MWPLDDTICAVASAPGGAVRGVVRLSGPEVARVLKNCLDLDAAPGIDGIRTASVLGGVLHLPPPLGPLPGELFYWPNRRSYTGQPAAEFHTWGSAPLLAAAVRTFCQHGARSAEPGEFTLRAFLAGRIDLPQAEAVLGVIDADNARRLTIALSQLAGGISRPLHQLREELLQLLAHLEAGLDFVDEDIEFISQAELEAALTAAHAQIADLLNQLGTRGTAHPIPRVVLTGPPNVGKSSLFNALLGKAAAMTSPVPGTTRDYLSARLDIRGIACELCDTAGLSATPQSEIDGMAQRAATELAKSADIILACNDCPAQHELPLPTDAAVVLRVLTKCDSQPIEAIPDDWIATSSVTGYGLKVLLNRLRGELVSRVPELVTGTAERCHDSLRLADASLRGAQDLNRNRAGEELIAAELRVALAELGKVTGAVYTEDILDRIFSRFCIGK